MFFFLFLMLRLTNEKKLFVQIIFSILIPRVISPLHKTYLQAKYMQELTYLTTWHS